MHQSEPIAVFDSGYGGLTILNDLLTSFPEYDFIYLGDNARSPYGGRSFDVVYRYTLQAVKALFEMGSPLIILACNTASAKALRTIQQIDLPRIDSSRRVLGVIRPSAEKIGELTQSGCVGILGTTGTVLSESYPLEIKKLFPHIRVEQESCPMWVPLVENNEHLSEGAHYFVKKNIENLFKKAPETDTIILGCTHYPLLKPVIEKHVPAGVKIISQGPIVAESLKDYFTRHPEMKSRISRNNRCLFYTTEHPDKFSQTASLFMDREITAIRLEY
ncbi:glutamate racemase [Alkalitalea saponilacus]|uniref:Glutamate racemase n=1 Tax=Alkalitalea saponilacus TaxID=889453 RepID=A0A1T5HT49_9BACT|nr:glutamate racemase [Alkalitalea saponilacus]ASB48523.1 glutamate racemase [Alkalitalea saponilacus]SKC23853.1 glutamate racemase [Alkalitalea saponilacus]